MYLFIDTCHNVTVGVLSSDHNWNSYEYLESKKSSVVLHELVDKHLKENNIDVSGLSGLIYLSGPGSYTGMRVSEGFAQILEWQNVKMNSFYHQDIAHMLDSSDWVWSAEAFKGEFFVYKDSSSKLLSKSEYDELKVKDNFSFVDTQKLIKEEPKLVFKYVLENNLRKDLYYYRPLEEEFRPKAGS